MRPSFIIFTIALAGSLSLARADQLQGRVLDANGVGVANVDIDAINKATGDEELLSNDFTDAQGFFDVVIPAGVYELRFLPPPPPTTTHLSKSIDDVVIVGTTNIGDVVLSPGVQLSGTVKTQADQAVPGVNIDLIDLSTGLEILLTNDQTDFAGQFVIAAPQGAIELQLDATPVQTPVLASKALELFLTGATDVGTVILPPGFVVSATVQRQNGTKVKSVDVDVIDVVTGDKVLTPGDNTNDAGFVDVVVAASTYRFEFCAPFAEHLVTYFTGNTVINANTSLGLITMQPGVVLSGHVDSSSSNGVANVDLDLYDSQTNAEIPTCGDNTSQDGNYALIVPMGTFDVVFTPPVGSGLSSLTVPDFVIDGNETLNVTLSDAGTVYCDETQNPNNAADIAIDTVDSTAGSIHVLLSNGPANQFVYLLVGNGSNVVNNPPGTKGSLCIVGGSCLGRYDKDVAQINTGGMYDVDIKNALSNPCQGGVNIVPGATWNFQFWHRQPMGTPSTFSAALSVTFQ